jgi:polyhydroxyalkanoate synthesis regulator phasin
MAGAVAVLAVGGAGAGIAATRHSNSPGQESKAIVDAAAKNLGVQPSELSAAIKQAMKERIDAAVAAGRLTKAQGDELKQRIDSGDFPLFGPPAFGPGFAPPHPFFHGLDAAETYLGLSEDELRSRLESGKTLAQIARDEGKSVDGLKQAMVADAKDKLDQAVKDGRLTRSEADRALQDLEQRVDDLVNGNLQQRFRLHHGFGFRGHGFEGPPPLRPAA